MDYKEYLQSEQWRYKRNVMISKFKTCQLCNSTENLEVHHRTYKNLGNEKWEDLTVLCNQCHHIFHQRSMTKEQREAAELKHKDWVRKQDAFLHYCFVSSEVSSLLRNLKQKELAQKVVDEYFDDLQKRGLGEDKMHSLRVAIRSNFDG